ncbi:hypothetical protein MMC16_007363 [Acarospora aff. strigata]|nr:hypothetical protein [Acarospora aff. strigata]
MLDEDGEWKPNGRPQSTLARSFSAALNEAFMIDNSLDGLKQSVEKKWAFINILPQIAKLRKKAVSSQSQELEALEARLRETEERLKQRRSRTSSPSSSNNARNTSHRRPGIGRAFGGRGSETEPASVTSPLAGHPPISQSPPSTDLSSPHPVLPMPGAMPQTPGETGSGDYVMVNRHQITQHHADSAAKEIDERGIGTTPSPPTRRAPPQPVD